MEESKTAEGIYRDRKDSFPNGINRFLSRTFPTERREPEFKKPIKPINQGAKQWAMQ